MLLPDNIQPEHSVYFNGAYVLQALKQNQSSNLLELFLHTQKQREMSMPLFVLCLDWLFLLNVVSISHQGKIELCS